MPSANRINRQLPVTSKDQLVSFLAGGARPESEWGIGAEMEKLVLDARTGEAAEFARVEALLAELAKSGAWQDIREGSRLVGLQGPHSSITLEPGGQLELSGQLCADLFCNCNDFSRHIIHAVAACEKLGLILVGLGTQPFTPLEEIEWAPKARYDIMGPYMLKSGDMGQRMMKQSAGLQVNLDFSDEADCMKKMRLAQALTPLLYGLFANSPIMDGKPTGFLTTRGEIWSRTDPDRTGLLPFLDKPDAGFADYVDYALDVPMYFIAREGKYIDLTQQRFRFRDFLDSGHDGHLAILADWDMHLSTLFPEIRLRPQIEVRSADSLPPHLVLTVAALLKGLLYDEESFQAAWEHCRPDSFAELEKSSRLAWRQGLRTPWKGGTLQDLARNCLTLARRGLDRQQSRRCQDRSESYFLDGLDDLINSGETLAEQLLQNWHGSRQDKLKALIGHCGFFDVAPNRLDESCANAQFKSEN
jgi:glutamate--cysteine ligase